MGSTFTQHYFTKSWVTYFISLYHTGCMTWLLTCEWSILTIYYRISNPIELELESEVSATVLKADSKIIFKQNMSVSASLVQIMSFF